jgi:hypothetical protein
MRRRRLYQVAIAGALVALAAVAWGAVRFRDYVQNDPGLCAHCHRTSSEFALWTKGSHRAVACQRCHHATTREGLGMLRAFLAGEPPGGRRQHAEVKLGACAQCHLSHDARWPQIEGSRGHKLHVEKAKIECVECHQAVHGFTPVVEACRKCHGQHAVQTVGMQQLHCFACHNFLSHDEGLRPVRVDCLRCHRENGVAPARFSDAAPMQFDCAACHHPHAKSRSQEQLPCLDCHRGVPRAGLHRSPGHEHCLDCHKPHLWKSGPERCAGCHEAQHAKGRSCANCHGFYGAGEPKAPAPRKAAAEAPPPARATPGGGP